MKTSLASVAAGALICGALFLGVSTTHAGAEISRSTGCGQPAPGAGSLGKKTADGTGRTRNYLVQVPTGYASGRNYPLVFVLHAAGGNARQSYGWGLQDVAGAATKAVFVFPEGINFQNYGIGWDDTANGYDLPFFDNMLKDLGASLCLDGSKVFVAGFSWGGDLAVALACQRGDKIRAVAVNSTDDEFKDPKNHLTYNGLPCAAHSHPPVRFVHAADGDKAYPAPLFATTSRLFQYLNACAATAPQAQPSTPPTSCLAYNACAGEYIECTFDAGLGHTLPPNWAEDTWAFFAKFM